jgi:ferredoxin-NADP reductase
VFYTSPELALLIANLWSFAIGQKQKLYLTLEEKRLVAKDTYEFVFAMNHAWQWLAGQYLELTLPHHKVDQRGVRRCFTVSSAPSEGKLKLGIKFPDKPSSFKQKLLDLQLGERINGGKAEGDFVLPRDASAPMLWLAGGIGVTPFRSMLKDLASRGEKRQIVLLYANRSGADIAYRELLTEMEQQGVAKVCYLVAQPEEGESYDGVMIDRATIERLAPAWSKSLVYISGPSAMVSALQATLKQMGLPGSRIKTDYFSGF